MIILYEISSGWPENTNDELFLIQIGLENDSTLRVNLTDQRLRSDPELLFWTLYNNKDPEKCIECYHLLTSSDWLLCYLQAGPSMPILDDTITVDDSNDNDDVDVTDDEYHDAAEPMEEDDFFSQSDIVSRYTIQWIFYAT